MSRWRRAARSIAKPMGCSGRLTTGTSKRARCTCPSGSRLQDQTALILQASGINMTTPTRASRSAGCARLDMQLAVSNGTAGGPVNSDGKQFSAQLIYVQPRWRLGLAANSNDQSVGHKNAVAVFGGLRRDRFPGWRRRTDRR